jgi:hypothetical protein
MARAATGFECASRGLLVGDVGVGEHVVAEHLHEVAGEPPLVAVDQFARSSTEIAGDLEQQRHRDLAAIVLDEVEIARRDPDRRGEVGLRQVALPPQPADAPADLHVLP